MITKERVFVDNITSAPVYYLKNNCAAFPETAGQNLVITLIREGSCILECRKQQYVVTAPAVLLINENAEISCVRPGNFDCESICFHPSFINVNLDLENIRKDSGYLNLTDRQDSYLFRIFGSQADSFVAVHLNSLDSRECAAYFDRFARAIEDKSESFWPCSAREVLIALHIFLKGLEPAEHRTADIRIPVNEYKLEEIILYLYSHYKEELNINTIAHEFGTNRTTLNLRFKEVIGCTVMKLLRNIRMNMAARLLRSSHMTISEISFDTGFQDISNFGKLFRQTFGCAPSNYRTMYSSFA